MNPPKIDQQITFIYATDLATSAKFYEEVMGFNLWLDQGNCRIYQVSTDGYIGVCQQRSPAPNHLPEHPPTNIILTIVTQEVDAWYHHLSARGIAFEKAPEHNPKYQIYHCFLRDPDGYLLEIQRFESL